MRWLRIQCGSRPANAEDFAIKFMAGAYYPQRAARERRTGTAHGNGATGSAGSALLTSTAALFEAPLTYTADFVEEIGPLTYMA